ncbi:type ISP restriction/modification enzyme [Thermodesulfobacteriota bacterium]
MSTNQRERLKNIRTFPSLVKYLRDELDWPIESDDFEEMTFEYSPEELGIDTKNAAKIQDIKRLRPMSVNQPWGIFFVKFEPKRLPVVALRRILSRVVVKKRASSNSAERTAWEANDLLFVSNYGEGEERRISFAHFSQEGQKRDLPTLKVLGWDNLDTALHLDHVADELHTKLVWPEEEEDFESWREAWRSAFTLKHREVIDTSRTLAIRLAELARAIRDRIRTILAIETEDGPVTKLIKAFQEALIHDLDEDGFSDMYAQTISYGLLSARITNPKGGTADDLAEQMPVTNPFLKDLMETFLTVGGRKGKAGSGSGIEFDELGVSEVVELLDNANMEAVVRDFGDRNPQEDPVIHFYELFLKEYDAKKRIQRGVFYTPRPVVSFIIRSVDKLLRTEFGLEDGLADTTTWGEMTKRFDDLKIPDGATPDQAFVQILDPATGTGTFLVEVIDIIHKTMVTKWEKEGRTPLFEIPALWNEYVPKHLLPRLHGYELLMAPYAIAHMKIGLKLYETGYHFGSDERARIYLTNSLEPVHDFSDRLAFAIPALAYESEAVNTIKSHKNFTILIGNPPYSIQSQNLTDTARAWVNAYRYVAGNRIVERNALQFEKNIQDDYIKFIRFSQVVVGSAAVGIVGLVTNHGFLDGATFRGMRWSLMESFTAIQLLDLHGNSNKREVAPDGSVDQNVFEISQGVAVSFMVNRSSEERICNVEHADLWGLRVGENGGKYAYLLTHLRSDVPWETLVPSEPLFLFKPSGGKIQQEYEQYPSLTEIMPLYSMGVKSSRDGLVVDHEAAPLLDRIERFRSAPMADEAICDKLGVSLKKGWNIWRARQALREVRDLEELVEPFLYRPFDWRLIFYHKAVVFSAAYPVMRNLLSGQNIALVVTRQTKDQWDVQCTRTLVGHKSLGAYDANTVFPLYVQPTNLALDLELGVSANISPEFLGRLRGSDRGEGISTTADEFFRYAYAVFHSPSYRDRYAGLLKTEFPRLPLANSPKLFQVLANLGDGLVALHLMESPKLNEFLTTLIGSGEFRVEKVSYSDETVWIDKAKSHGFRGMPENVWNSRIGGYQVCEKWLKDRQAKGGKNPRPGRILTNEDINHYQKIIVALNETIRIMQEIDEVIEEHGGWPDAFNVNTGDK